MSAHSGFGMEALRRARQEESRLAAEPASGPPALEQVPPDAPYDDPDAVLHAWNGDRWVPWKKWLATATRAAAEEYGAPDGGWREEKKSHEVQP